MDSQQSLPENVKNTVRYKLYLSRTPEETIVQGYRERIKPICEYLELQVEETEKICHGSHEVNQNIEREWLIIYALYELSKFDRDLVITVQDSDGEILLITAAEEIPKWLESSKSKDRVFIHQGKLHIIPEEVNLKDLQKRYSHCSSTICQAASYFVRDMNSTPVISGRVKTLADRPIQAAIEDQLSGMPDQGAWLSRKFRQLDEILSGQDGMNDKEELQKRFDADLSLASVMAMDEQDLMISPISSRSSSSWLTEQEDD